MRKNHIIVGLSIILAVVLVIISILIMNHKENNPLLSAFDAPHQTAPFDKIKLTDYEPAFIEAIRQHDEEIQQIVANTDEPTFDNTIAALDFSGNLLQRVGSIFFNLSSAETNEEMQELAQKLSPILTEHSNNVSLNEALFARIKKVMETADQTALTPEQQKLLQETYDGFVRSGANLNAADKEEYRKLTSELSQATLQFSQNELNATNAYTLHLTDSTRLQGLPESAIEAAAETAKEAGKEGWVFTLQAPSYVPFMTYCQDRGLRKELFMAYNTLGTANDAYNNEEIVKKIVNLRLAIAKLLGFDSYADYTLVKRMAENTTRVMDLFHQLTEAYMPTARHEVEEIQTLAQREQGTDFKLMPWDWLFYSEKLKDEKYSLNDEMLRPYFQLDKVVNGIFGLASRLYGITFKENKNIPVFHPDVTAYEVFDNNGLYLAVLYTDFFPREGKQSGAWMTSYKGQWKKNNEDSRPHVSITTNFTKPTDNKPSLLTLDEVETFIHEFGHSLHGIFARTTYPSIASPEVAWDFVELPSQIMENFVTEKEFLSTFAHHYQTGEVLPDSLIERIVKADNFNAAYGCIRQVSLGMIDMAWYTRTTPFEGDVRSYEKKVLQSTQLLPSIPQTCMTTHFGHIMSGGYSAGYYSYKWAEVLDADAFSLFKEKGIFNQEVATSFRENILSKGSSEHPMVLYKRFRGQEPTIEALLKRNGIIH